MKGRWFLCGLLLVLSLGVALGCGPAAIEPTPAPTPAPTATEGPAPRPTAASEQPKLLVGDPEAAIDMALGYMNRWHGQQFPAPGLTWVGQYPSKPDVVGVQTILYTSKGAPNWAITVHYPVVLPELTIYQVTVVNDAIGFRWVGKVDATGVVTEENLLIEK